MKGFSFLSLVNLLLRYTEEFVLLLLLEPLENNIRRKRLKYPLAGEFLVRGDALGIIPFTEKYFVLS